MKGNVFENVLLWLGALVMAAGFSAVIGWAWCMAARRASPEALGFGIGLCFFLTLCFFSFVYVRKQ